MIGAALRLTVLAPSGTWPVCDRSVGQRAEAEREAKPEPTVRKVVANVEKAGPERAGKDQDVTIRLPACGR